MRRHTSLTPWLTVLCGMSCMKDIRRNQVLEALGGCVRVRRKECEEGEDVCVSTCIDAHKHADTHTKHANTSERARTHTHTCAHTHKHMRTHARARTHTHTHTHTHMRTRTHTHTCV